MCISSLTPPETLCRFESGSRMPLLIQLIYLWKDSEFTFEAKMVRFSIAPNIAPSCYIAILNLLCAREDTCHLDRSSSYLSQLEYSH